MIGFSPANAKIKKLAKVPQLKRFLLGKRKVYSFDLLSGWSCPFAKDCLSKVYEINGSRKLKDGPFTQFRCFSASQEALLTGVYNKRKANLDLMRANHTSALLMADLLNDMMPDDAGIIRIHVAGDFFNRNYFLAWLWVAVYNPSVLFYAYTKSLNYWTDNLDIIPNNFILTASRGGKLDILIDEHNLRESVVVYSEKQADNLGLEIDHDDSHAAIPAWKNRSFALLIHGVQPAGSEASKALRKLKGKGSYARS